MYIQLGVDRACTLLGYPHTFNLNCNGRAWRWSFNVCYALPLYPLTLNSQWIVRACERPFFCRDATGVLIRNSIFWPCFFRYHCVFLEKSIPATFCRDVKLKRKFYKKKTRRSIIIYAIFGRFSNEIFLLSIQSIQRKIEWRKLCKIVDRNNFSHISRNSAFAILSAFCALYRWVKCWNLSAHWNHIRKIFLLLKLRCQSCRCFTRYIN